MVVKNPKFEKSCIKTDQLPESNLLEIAFCGRSNVGKSSLINALLNRKNLAKSGSKQGMTRLINYFNIDDEIYFVDLPGYGYAKVSKEEMGRWGEVIENYLTKRPQLYIMMLLVDIRHDPTKEDLMLYGWTKKNNIEYIVVATKADKLSRMQVLERCKIIKEKMGLPTDKNVFAVSSENKKGIPELWQEIDSYIMEDDDETTVL